MATTPYLARTFDVRIEYFSGDGRFAVETIRLEAHEGDDIELAARLAAEASPYHDERVPDLSFQISIQPVDPDEPTPPFAGAPVKPVCSRCGADHLVRDACARWDVDTQRWEMSGIFDCTTCDLCSAESDDLEIWVPAGQETPPERFTRELAAKFDAPALIHHPPFVQLCLDYFRDESFEAAEAKWRSTIVARP